MAVKNDASFRVVTTDGTFDKNGFVTIVVPAATDLGRGAVLLDFAASVASVWDWEYLIGVQDGVNAVYTIAGSASWVKARIIRNGQLIDPATYSLSGTGNRTVTLSMASLPDDQGGTFPEILEAIGIAI